MTPRSRLGLAIAALVVLVGGFVIAKGSGDNTSTTTATTPPPAVATSGATSTGAPATPAVQQIAVTGGKPAGGVQQIKVAKGDRVRFAVTSDVADEIHVHGYDFHKDVTAGGSVSFDFKATIDGKFDIELENAGEQIASLTVTP